jgi:hypothetical protein
MCSWREVSENVAEEAAEFWITRNCTICTVHQISLIIIWVLKSRSVRRVGYAARMGHMTEYTSRKFE